MLRSHLVIAGLATTFVAVWAGCGSSTPAGSTSTSTGTGGSTTTSSSSGMHAEPPGPGPMKPGDGPTSVTFAVSKLYLGDIARDGTPDKSNGWKKFGFDIDGKISTKDSTDLCKTNSGGTKSSVYPDGDDGIDNSFGRNILPIILGLASDASSKINDSILKGTFTLMLDVDKLGTSADYNPLTTRLYAGADLGMAPKFDGSDKWPVRPELLTNPTDIKSSKVQFPSSYVTGNTWVSGSKGDVTLSLSIQGYTLNLTIGSAQIAMQLDPTHKKVTNGTIAGVLETEVLTTELKKVAGGFNASLCSGSTIDSIITQIKQASDIMKDGSQDAAKTCDGISIGLGFDGDVVQIGAIAPASMPGTDPCMGTGGAGGGG